MDKNEFIAFGKRIRARRKQLGLNQAELAAKCGTSLAYIGHMERATRSPSMEILLALCQALSVTPDYLLQDLLDFKHMLSPQNPLREQDARSLERIAQIIRENSVEYDFDGGKQDP